jgi:protein Mpv17
MQRALHRANNGSYSMSHGSGPVRIIYHSSRHGLLLQPARRSVSAQARKPGKPGITPQPPSEQLLGPAADHAVHAVPVTTAWAETVAETTPLETAEQTSTPSSLATSTTNINDASPATAATLQFYSNSSATSSSEDLSSPLLATSSASSSSSIPALASTKLQDAEAPEQPSWVRSAFEVVTGPYRAYAAFLHRHPVPAKAATSFVGFIIGDLIAQHIEFGMWANPARTMRLGTYGLMLDGPVGHAWYRLIDRTVLPDKPTSTPAVLAKTAADQLLWAPAMTCVFFTFIRCLEGRPELIVSTIQAKLGPTIFANYLCWPLAHVINFKYVAPEYRILYNNVVSIAWISYFSMLTHSNVHLLDFQQLF